MREVSRQIEPVLKNCPETRDNDDILYMMFLKLYHPECLSMSMSDFLMKSAYDKAIPSRETVGRCRRRLQTIKPELRASEDAEFDRIVKEEEWRAFAREC